MISVLLIYYIVYIVLVVVGIGIPCLLFIATDSILCWRYRRLKEKRRRLEQRIEFVVDPWIHNTNDPFHNINQQSENHIIYNEDRITSAIAQDLNLIASTPVENIVQILMDPVCMMQHSLHNNTDVNYCKWMNEREMNPLSNNAGNFYRINNATCDNSVFIFLMLRQLPVAPSLTILQYLQFRISNVSRL
jgi:hypothetical protein